MENSLGKNRKIYELIRNETYTYEQKPINVDDFNNVEEKEETKVLKNESVEFV